jgi:hypothetical protein
VSVGELRAEHGQGLQDVAGAQGLAHVPSEQPVIDSSNVPQNPSARESQASVQPVGKETSDEATKQSDSQRFIVFSYVWQAFEENRSVYDQK